MADRYHAGLIQEGGYISRCLFYIPFNMVRAGVVEHPDEWKHSGYHELSGDRHRYKIVNMKRLLKCLRMGSVDQFRQWYSDTVREKVGQSYHSREAFWSEAIAIGGKGWISKMAGKVSNRKRVSIRSESVSPASETTIREETRFITHPLDVLSLNVLFSIKKYV